VAIMMESHLYEGNQKHDNGDASKLKYGVSITDPCTGWEQTEGLIREAFHELSASTAKTVSMYV
ncbi:MAG: 3-deoxy-7-phosphoheptulonate synthase, partial [bacterium]|nr:3-deoxy-7-phosphoheptulonate synthase [bacterium]